MNEITKKINKAKDLNDCLDRTKAFLELLQESQEATGDNKWDKINNLHSIKIGANICTGSQSPHYDEAIYSDIEFINTIAKTLMPLCEDRIKNIWEELNNLIK